MIAPCLPRLPPRLRRVLELTPPAAGRVADVGAGHGVLAAHLAARGAAVIATEAAPAPWAELRANLARWGMGETVEVRRGPGLEPLARGEVDVAVVAGVGARTLLEVAAEAPDCGVPALVLQCVQDAGLVEPWLRGRGWVVVAADDVPEAGRRYPTWLVEVGR